MDSHKTDIDDGLQQIQSIGSIEEAKNCLKTALLSV
jgi:hypothetical protein